MIVTQRRAGRERGAAGVGGQRDEISCWESLLQDGGQEPPSASALEAFRFRVGAWLGCPHSVFKPERMLQEGISKPLSLDTLFQSHKATWS